MVAVEEQPAVHTDAKAVMSMRDSIVRRIFSPHLCGVNGERSFPPLAIDY
jgi:hypothetical protein